VNPFGQERSNKRDGSVQAERVTIKAELKFRQEEAARNDCFAWESMHI
jgi:hypothetical protein